MVKEGVRGHAASSTLTYMKESSSFFFPDPNAFHKLCIMHQKLFSDFYKICRIKCKAGTNDQSDVNSKSAMGRYSDRTVICTKDVVMKKVPACSQKSWLVWVYNDSLCNMW